ncbi:cytochrome c3 family protein [Solitalea koreensis]|uniref:Quinol:cytochrome c oxidoreductase pentaheme cytochrome subunit n=1 Tax=Solitalea koreensis TaxID=543615 RepID=A0A521AX18_9SPHI|nr:c-type cytochrome [Solitalea koreensis]SMO39271.1 quinol:cytochrome c oxidoreductase pentaheme cytochrome subunit [Solitalea koreensis]
MSTNPSVFLKNYLKKGLLILTFVFFGVAQALAADPKEGETLFKANCSSCHAVGKKVTGPALKDVDKRHEEAWIIKWVHNSQAMVKAGDPVAVKLFNENNQSVMTAFPNLTEDNVKSILAYIKQEGDAIDKAAAAGPVGGAAAESKGTSTFTIFSLLGLVGVLLLVIWVLNRVIKTLEQIVANRKAEGLVEEEVEEEEKPSAFAVKLKKLALNKKVIALSLLTAIVVLSAWSVREMWFTGVTQNYQPVQPIKFSHKIHAGVNQINCQYCHSGAFKSKNASIPSANVCMNCHSQINEYKGEPIFDAEGEKIDGTAEIQKIYAALDYDPTTQKYGTNTRPIEWIRIHNLPDFAYFNHSQHVKVAEESIRAAKGLKAEDPVCYACHGEVAKMDEVYQYSPLTMKWCINCHRETDMKHLPKNHYYDNMVEVHDRIKRGEKVTVAQMGGLECSKCHY